MKFILLSLLLIFPGFSFGGQILRVQCAAYQYGTMTHLNIVESYNLSTLGSDNPHRGLNVFFHGDERWYHLGYDVPAFSYIYDMVKSAFLTKYPIEACVDKAGNYLLGTEWSPNPHPVREGFFLKK